MNGVSLNHTISPIMGLANLLAVALTEENEDAEADKVFNGYDKAMIVSAGPMHRHRGVKPESMTHSNTPARQLANLSSAPRSHRTARTFEANQQITVHVTVVVLFK